MLAITTENYEAEVIQSDKPVILKFWAVWCGYCIQLNPVVEELEKEHPDVKFCTVNTDEAPLIAAQYGIMSIPACVRIEKGEVITKVVGALPKDELAAQLKLTN